MAVHRIEKGLSLPLAGAPQQSVDRTSPTVTRVGLIAADYVGMKPRMAVREGDAVKRGQLLFEDRKREGVRFTAPGAGTVVGIHRGERRALQSVVIELSASEAAGRPTGADYQPFESYRDCRPAELTRDDAVALLQESGLWTALRARPFSHVPSPQTEPAALFITAIDTQPHAPSVDVVLAERTDDFRAGVEILSKLTSGPTYVCIEESSTLAAAVSGLQDVRVEKFVGAHPAGTAGLHIHRLHPVNREHTVWHIGYQDVAATGSLFRSGKLDTQRIISLAGPGVKRPRLLCTRLGANLDALVAADLQLGEQRVISGSVLSGRKAQGDLHGYLGRYHNQVAVLREGRERKFLSWLGLGLDKFSTLPVYLGRFFDGRRGAMALTTSTNGSLRALVPVGLYERVMPMDVMPTFLLRALLSGDVERATQLGALELDEEDLALCTFVCPGKNDYGPLLRENLIRIEKDG